MNLFPNSWPQHLRNLISVKDLYLLQANLSWSFPAWIPPAGARFDRKWNPKFEGIKNIKLQVQTNKQNIKSLSGDSFPTSPQKNKNKKHVNNWKIKHDNVVVPPGDTDLRQWFHPWFLLGIHFRTIPQTVSLPKRFPATVAAVRVLHLLFQKNDKRT